MQNSSHIHVCPKKNCHARGVKDLIYMEFFKHPKPALLACDNIGVLPCMLLYYPITFFPGKRTAASLAHNSRERFRQDLFRGLFQERNSIIESGDVEDMWRIRELSFLFRKESVPGLDVLSEYEDKGDDEGGDDDHADLEGRMSRTMSPSEKTQNSMLSNTQRHSPSRPATVPHPPSLPPCVPHSARRLPKEKIFQKMLENEAKSLQTSAEAIQKYGEMIRKGPKSQRRLLPSTTVTTPDNRQPHLDDDDTPASPMKLPQPPRSHVPRNSDAYALSASQTQSKRENRAVVKKVVKDLLDHISQVEKHNSIDTRLEDAKQRRLEVSEEYRLQRAAIVNMEKIHRGMEAFVMNVAQQSKATERREFLQEITLATAELEDGEEEARIERNNKVRYQHMLKDKLLRLVKLCEHEAKVEETKRQQEAQVAQREQQMKAYDESSQERVHVTRQERLSSSRTKLEMTDAKIERAQQYVKKVRNEWHVKVEEEHLHKESQREVRVTSQEKEQRSQIAILAEIRELRAVIAKERREAAERAKTIRLAKFDAEIQLKMTKAQHFKDQSERTAQNMRMAHEQQRVLRQVVGGYLAGVQTTKRYVVPDEFHAVMQS